MKKQRINFLVVRLTVAGYQRDLREDKAVYIQGQGNMENNEQLLGGLTLSKIEWTWI